VQLAPELMDAWEQCRLYMRTQPEACGSLSPHLVTYIRCVYQLQAELKRHGATVYGVHYPTLIATTRSHAFLAPAFDAYVGNRLVQDGGWMFHEVRLMQHLTPVHGVFIDAGANIGGFTIPLARHVGRKGRVISFEPYRHLYQVLTANVALNGLANVWTHQVGLGNETLELVRRMPDLNQVSNPSKSHMVDGIASTMLVSYGEEDLMYVRPLDSFDFPRVDMIKIDVESMELPMLYGARATLRAHRPLVFVEDSEIDDMASMRSPTSVMNLLSTVGYICINLEQSGLPGYTSLLCVPQERQQDVMARLNTFSMN
jgi:FkbM family methyltransferase